MIIRREVRPDPGPNAGPRQRAGVTLLAAARIEREAAIDYLHDRETPRKQVEELTAEARPNPESVLKACS